MPLSVIFSELAAYIASPDFLLTARHPDHPTAFTRNRKLPLASLVAVLLCCCAAVLLCRFVTHSDLLACLDIHILVECQVKQ